MKHHRFLFALIMAMVMMAISPLKVWALSGYGSTASPYLIYNADDLLEYASIINSDRTQGNAKLMANIDLTGKTWTPIGSQTYPFRNNCTFDGNGKSISGMNLTATTANAGLFGYVNNATIQNFTLAGSITSNSDNVGSVVGSADGATKIYNVYSSVGITMSAARSHIGGIAGQLLQETGKVPEIKGCTYSGTMNLGSTTDSNGGIVGYCEKDANVQIEYCFFSGSISSSGSNPRIGGILGYADDENSQNFNYIRNCYCDGTLSPSSGTYVGAIAGYPRGNVPGVITNNTYKSGMATNALGNGKTSSTSTPITISVTANNNTYGSVSQSYVNPTSTTATQLEVVATPADHYYFKSWSDDGAQTHNVDLTEKVSLTATFARKLIITVKTNNSEFGTVSGGGEFKYNSNIRIEAFNKEHYHLVQWNDGITNSLRWITVTEDKTYTAQFAIDQHTITVKANNSNYGTVSGGGTFDYGTSNVSITASPKTHYHFVSWNDGNTNASRAITVTEDKTYTATFALNSYTITVKANDDNYGTVSGGGTFDYNSTKTITATPKTGYHFVKWSDGDTHASRSVTVSDNATYTATFATHTYGNWITDQAATCASAGSKHHVCTQTGCDASEAETIPMLSHNMTTHAAQDATCTEAGNLLYYTCSRSCCSGKYYKDNDAHTTTTYADLAATVVDALGHDLTEHAAHDATCTEAGNQLYYTCSCSCCAGKYYKDNATYTTTTYADLAATVVDALGHDLTEHAAHDATCTEEGNLLYYTCSHSCCSGMYYDDNTATTTHADQAAFVLAALGHDFAPDYTVDAEPNCGTEGSKSKHCHRCSATTDAQSIPATGSHTFAANDPGHTLCSECGHGFIYFTTTGNDLSYVDNKFTDLVAHTFDPETQSGKLEFSKAVTDIPALAFRSKQIVSITLPLSLVSIGSEAFSDCSYLLSIDIPEGVTSIGGYAFSACSSLESVTLPSTLQSIKACTFQICKSLKEITLDDITIIGERAFENCQSLTSLSMPKVTEIYSQAFILCSKLTTVYCPKLRTNDNSFIYCDELSELTVSCYLGLALAVPATVNVTRVHQGDNLIDVEAVAPTCTEPGNIAYTYCNEDDCMNANWYNNGSYLEPLGHDMIYHAPTASTCMTEGNEEYWSCSRDFCAGIFYADDKGNHTLEALPAIATSEHTWGEGNTCTVCQHLAEIAHTGTSGTCTWSIFEDGSLIIEPTEGESGTLGDPTDYDMPWFPFSKMIRSVAFRGKVMATSCLNMFYDCVNLQTADFTNFNTENVTSMVGMFNGCSSLKQLNLNNFNTLSVDEMDYMFKNCTSLQLLDLSSFNTMYVRTTSEMFYNCRSLATLKLSNQFTKGRIVHEDMFTNWCADLVSAGTIYFITDYELVDALFIGTGCPRYVCNPYERTFDEFQEKILSNHLNDSELLIFDHNYDGKVTVSDLTRWIWIEQLKEP